MLNLLTFLQACLNATLMRHRRMSIVDTHLHGYPNFFAKLFSPFVFGSPSEYTVLAVSTYSTFPLSHLSLSFQIQRLGYASSLTCVTGDIFVRRTRVYALR